MTEKKKILVADDEPINQMILEEMLCEEFDLTFVDSGRGCLQSLKESRPALILMDVYMPDMDGLETCEIIKSLPDYSDIPIIFVSALAARSEVNRGLEAGGDAYICKPFEEKELLKTISEHL